MENRIAKMTRKKKNKKQSDTESSAPSDSSDNSFDETARTVEDINAKVKQYLKENIIEEKNESEKSRKKEKKEKKRREELKRKLSDQEESSESTQMKKVERRALSNSLSENFTFKVPSSKQETKRTSTPQPSSRNVDTSLDMSVDSCISEVQERKNPREGENTEKTINKPALICTQCKHNPVVLPPPPPPAKNDTRCNVRGQIDVRAVCASDRYRSLRRNFKNCKNRTKIVA